MIDRAIPDDRLTPETRARAQQEYYERQFLSLGTQYYIAARHGYFARSLPVAATNFHHAVEMFLKGFLCRTVSVEDLKHRYGHFLNRLWQAFKAETGDASLNVFDGTVAALDAFAELRYPSEDGFTVQFALEGPINPASGPAGSRTFGLVIRDLDTLVQVIIRHAAITPEFLVMSMSAEGRAALARDNATGIWPP